MSDSPVMVLAEYYLVADDSAPHEAKLMAVAAVTENDHGARLFDSSVRDADWKQMAHMGSERPTESEQGAKKN